MKKIKKIKTSIAFIILFVSLSSCEFENNSTTSSLVADNSSATSDSGIACYLNTCLETTALSTINLKDYVYPNPDSFPNSEIKSQYSVPKYILDLNQVLPGAKLSPNFRVSELMSKRRGRYGLFSSHVVSQLQFIRNAINSSIQVNSGYRSPGYNNDTPRSAKWSRHMYGDAVDIFASGVQLTALADLCKEFGASFTLIYTSHIHCDWRLSQLDPAFYDSQINKLTQNFILSPAQLYSAQSQLLVTQLSQSKTIIADLHINEEIEGELTYAWEAHLPDGQVLRSNEHHLHLPDIRGQHYIKVTIGGSIIIDNSFIW